MIRLLPPRAWIALAAAVLGLLMFALAARAWQRPERQAGARTGDHPPNRLAGETSPYLLQHARNPVDWYPWGEEAFARAKREGKPVFLSIGYSACHWCHVMERESFEDQGVARILNEGFIAIKVDREERPDVDEIYMTSVQLLTGRGGWPMSTFLTPDGKPFFGGTYFPRDEFAELLRKIAAAWNDSGQRKQIDQAAERLARAVGETTAAVPQAGSVSPALFAPAVKTYLESFDRTHGGFGAAPKFPPSMRLALMLAEHRKRPDPQLLQAVTFTLDRMARGGMYDQVGGGFHRYSVDEKWLVPHFEKMLYDNALLAWVYLEAFQVTGNPYYRRIATETLDFTLRELRDPQGGFWSTLDADSEGEEGKFYVWTPSEVIAALGRTDGALFNRLYNVTPGGNFEGKNIPNLIARPVDARAKELKTTPEALWARLDRLRARLLVARSKRDRPHLDDKVLSSWNGLMLRPLALAYEITGDERYRQAAEAAAEFVLSTMRKNGRLLHSYRKGKTQPQAFLEDYSFMIVGLLELHRSVGEARGTRLRVLREAEALAKVMVADFWDESGGTFFTTPHHHEPLLTRLKSAEDGATPSGQSMAALALVRLSRLGESADLRVKARRLLDTHATMMKRHPAAVPTMLLAAHRYFTPEESSDPRPASGYPVRVTATLAGAPKAVRPGETFSLTVRLAIAPGWHLNAASTRTGLLPTRVTPAGGPFRLLSANYPAGKTLRAGFSKEPLEVYDGQVAIPLRLRALPGSEKARALRLRLRYQACSDRLCEPPRALLLVAPLSSREGK